MSDTPMTPEEEAAHKLALEQPIPQAVIDQATMLGDAFMENKIMLSTYVPPKSTHVYYMLSTLVNGSLVPLSIIPGSMSPTEWLHIVDKLIRKHGTKELDHDFNGRTH